MQSIKLPLAVILFLSLVWFVAGTIHWPLAGDAALMHYVVFLTRHGFVPYKEIGDINLPGCYLPDFLVTTIFGPSSLAWRLYDFALLGAIGAAFALIAKSQGWFPALWAACLFAVIHGRDGIDQAGQRDLAAAALLAVGMMCLFQARRSGHAWSALVWGVCAGSAAMIKPTLTPFILVTLVDLASHRTDPRAHRRAQAAFSGWFVAPAACLVWLAHHGALRAFRYSMDVLAPYHASVGHASWKVLLHDASSPITLVMFVWLAALAIQRLTGGKLRLAESLTVERRMLIGATLLGLLSYVLQGKGFPYHRYPFLMFLLMTMAMDLTVMLRKKPVIAWLSAAALVGSSIVIAPSSALKASRYDWRQDEFRSMLEADLNQIAQRAKVPTMAYEVQCLDTISGCLRTLEHMQVPEKFGLTYDEFLFHAPGHRAVDETRASFQGHMSASPPLVLIVTEPLFPSGPEHYEKLAQWPEFNRWLQENYRLDVERHPTMPIRTMGRSIIPPGYRLYVSRRLDDVVPER